MPHPDMSSEMPKIYFNSEQMVLQLAVEDDELKDKELETKAAENSNLEEITGMDNKIR